MGNEKLTKAEAELTNFKPNGIWDTIAGIAQVYLLGFNLMRPGQDMSSVIGDIARSFPELLNSINSIQSNITSIRAAIENIDEEIRGVFNEQLALEALSRAKSKAEQIKTLMKDDVALRVNADAILEKSMEIEEEINVFLERTQTKEGDVVGLYLTAPLISIYAKAFTYSSRQKYLNLGEDPASAPNAFESALTKKIIRFSENLVLEYIQIEAKYKPFKDLPLPEDKEYAYRFDPGFGLVKTDIKQWGFYPCLRQFGTLDPKFIPCLMDGLDNHQGESWKNLYTIYQYLPNSKPYPFAGLATNYQEINHNGRTAKGWTFHSINDSPQHQVVFRHMARQVEAYEFYAFKSGKFFKDINQFTAIVETMKSGTWEVLKFSDKYYRAHCPDHDWEGQRQSKEIDAEMDLDAHIQSFPDEGHVGAAVIESESH